MKKWRRRGRTLCGREARGSNGCKPIIWTALNPHQKSRVIRFALMFCYGRLYVNITSRIESNPFIPFAQLAPASPSLNQVLNHPKIDSRPALPWIFDCPTHPVTSQELHFRIFRLIYLKIRRLNCDAYLRLVNMKNQTRNCSCFEISILGIQIFKV